MFAKSAKKVVQRLIFFNEGSWQLDLDFSDEKLNLFFPKQLDLFIFSRTTDVT